MNYTHDSMGNDILFLINDHMVDDHDSNSTNIDNDKKVSISSITSRVEQIIDELLWDTKM